MPDSVGQSDNPLYWPLEELVAAYRRREISPVEVLELALARIDAHDAVLHAFLGRGDELARRQARAAEISYREGSASALSGIPVSIKDTFPIEGQVTTFGSLVFRETVSDFDCGAVERLRAAGAIFTGRTNTAEFGQSATTANRFFADVRNPWDIERSCGGSSGGAAASVLAGLSSIALGADGGGSIRIPAAFTGLFGMKPTYGLCRNERGLAAMSDFVCPGPLSWNVADGRRLLAVLAERDFPRRDTRRNLRLAWCANPEGRPTEPGLDAATRRAVDRLEDLGHRIDEVDVETRGWDEIFGPLVLDEERRERGHLLESGDLLTDYEKKSLEAARALTAREVQLARVRHEQYRRRLQAIFDDYDFVLTPTTAVPAFELGAPPDAIDGRKVSRTWGAYPFTAAFNVAGNPAASIPCGFSDRLPVGLQLVAPLHADAELLDLAEDMQELLRYDRGPIVAKWANSGVAAVPESAER